jgi:hypothetical protein
MTPTVPELWTDLVGVVGYADAVMRQALADARVRWGIERTVLHATPAGRPMYTRMGYAATNEFQIYIGAGATG